MKHLMNLIYDNSPSPTTGDKIALSCTNCLYVGVPVHGLLETNQKKTNNTNSTTLNPNSLFWLIITKEMPKRNTCNNSFSQLHIEHILNFSQISDI